MNTSCWDVWSKYTKISGVEIKNRPMGWRIKNGCDNDLTEIKRVAQSNYEGRFRQDNVVAITAAPYTKYFLLIDKCLYGVETLHHPRLSFLLVYSILMENSSLLIITAMLFLLLLPCFIYIYICNSKMFLILSFTKGKTFIIQYLGMIRNVVVLSILILHYNMYYFAL